jgi:hypothetical protein
MRHVFSQYKCGGIDLFFVYVLQALYFCVPFRDQLLEYYGNNKSIGDGEETMLTCLADLFSQVLLQLFIVVVIPSSIFACALICG